MKGEFYVVDFPVNLSAREMFDVWDSCKEACSGPVFLHSLYSNYKIVVTNPDDLVRAMLFVPS